MAVIFNGKFYKAKDNDIDITYKDLDDHLFGWNIDEDGNLYIDSIIFQPECIMMENIQYVSKYYAARGSIEYMDNEDGCTPYQIVLINGTIRKYKGSIVYNTEREVLL